MTTPPPATTPAETVCPACCGAGAFGRGLMGERIPQFTGVSNNSMWPCPGMERCETCQGTGRIPAPHKGKESDAK